MKEGIPGKGKGDGSDGREGKGRETRKICDAESEEAREGEEIERREWRGKGRY